MVAPAMSKPFTPSKRTVELEPPPRPSRIRRDPVPQAADRSVRAYPTEREIWLTVIGVVLFAVAITALMLGISDITSH